jgi:tripartite-type tricarboxylate transporter receptor subunit TctC
LAVTSAERTPLAPNVPTIAENGLPPFEMLTWYGLWAPRGIGADVQAYLGKEVAAAVNSPKFRDRLTALGFEPTYRDSAGLEAYVVEEMKRYDLIVKAANIKMQ